MAKLIEFTDSGVGVTNREQLFKISNSLEKYIEINPSTDIEDYIHNSTHYVTIDKRNSSSIIGVHEQLFPTSIYVSDKKHYKFGSCRHITANILHVDHNVFVDNVVYFKDYCPDGWSIQQCDSDDDQFGDFAIRHLFDNCNGLTVGQYLSKYTYGTIPKPTKSVNDEFQELMLNVTTPVEEADYDSYYYNIQRRQIGTAVRNTVFDLIKANNWNVNIIGPEFESFELLVKLLISDYTGNVRLYTIDESANHDYNAELRRYKKKNLTLAIVLAVKWKFENAFCRLLLHHLLFKRSFSCIYVHTAYNVENWVNNYKYLPIKVVESLQDEKINSIYFGFKVIDCSSSYALNEMGEKVVYTPTPYDDKNNAWIISICGKLQGNHYNKDDAIASKLNNYSNFVYGGNKFTADDLDLNYVNIGLYSISNTKNSKELLKTVMSYSHIITFPLHQTFDWKDTYKLPNEIFPNKVTQNKFEDWIINPKLAMLELGSEIVSEMVFLQISKYRCFISDIYQHCVSFRFRQKEYFSDKTFSHIGIRQVSIYNRDRYLTSRLNAYVNRQASKSIDMSTIVKTKFGGFSGHLIAVETFTNQLIYTMSPMRWSKRAFSDMIYKKNDPAKNADGEKHTREDFVNTYAYLDMYYTFFEDKLVNNETADNPSYYIAVKVGEGHITLQLTNKDPSMCLEQIIGVIKGIQLRLIGLSKFGTLPIALYQTESVIQYHIVKILRKMNIGCQQSRPYIMHMTMKEGVKPISTVTIDKKNVYCKKINA
uniref:Viral structural protein 3 n=1 Tax=Ruddy turnstone rotavirus TaxID=2212774 RepID=A0A3G1RPF8_9REOV|nr:MAG: viral structural protein 3 [Ruddy turnstone rotavirus]